ncbi:MAG: hypothetical protein ACK2UW_25130, partial [Anaerolineales bacterium]
MRNEIRSPFLLLTILALALLLAACGGIAQRINPPVWESDELHSQPVGPWNPSPYPGAPEFQGEVWVTPVMGASGSPNPTPQFIYPPPQIYPAATTLPYPHPTFEPLPLPPTPTLNPAPEVAMLNPNAIDQLSGELMVAPLGVGGAAKLTGWPFGLRSSGYCETGPYQWLDDRHLLVHLLYGTTQEIGRYERSVEVLLRWSSRNGWELLDPDLIPLVPNTACGANPRWSPASGTLIIEELAYTDLLSPDGVRLDSFPYTSVVSLSPSGEWLALSSQFNNLKTKETIPITRTAGDLFWSPGDRRAWDTQEQQFFGCCHMYGSRQTGELHMFNLGDLWFVDSYTYPGQVGLQPFWTTDGERVMYLGAASFPRMDGTNPIGILPLIDPAAGTYEDLRILAGLSPDDPCELVAAAPNGRAALAKCGSGWQLFDLDRYTAQRLSLDGEFQVLPAPDSVYFLLAAVSPDSSWLSAADGSRLAELGPLPAAPAWHPRESWQPGPWFVVHTVYAYTLFASALATIVLQLNQQSSLYRRQM